MKSLKSQVIKPINSQIMKSLKSASVILLCTFLLTSCNNDDDNPTLPQPVNEEEVITTLTAILTPNLAGGTAITLKTQDLDGDGPNVPVVTVSGNLTPNTTYNGVITLLNETVSPAENITTEVEEESNEHQFFYTIGNGLNITTEYTNNDANGNPLGTEFKVITSGSSSGDLTFTLRHEPTKPNDGTLDNAGGETDISATFDITIQ